jgi:hypothetical protein
VEPVRALPAVGAAKMTFVEVTRMLWPSARRSPEGAHPTIKQPSVPFGCWFFLARRDRPRTCDPLGWPLNSGLDLTCIHAWFGCALLQRLGHLSQREPHPRRPFAVRPL